MFFHHHSSQSQAMSGGADQVTIVTLARELRAVWRRMRARGVAATAAPCT